MATNNNAHQFRWGPINELRNTKVAHQESPLTNPGDAKSALLTWIDGFNRLWRANRTR